MFSMVGGSQIWNKKEHGLGILFCFVALPKNKVIFALLWSAGHD